MTTNSFAVINHYTVVHSSSYVLVRTVYKELYL
jgi:hypothetical protein